MFCYRVVCVSQLADKPQQGRNASRVCQIYYRLKNIVVISIFKLKTTANNQEKSKSFTRQTFRLGVSSFFSCRLRMLSRGSALAKMITLSLSLCVCVCVCCCVCERRWRKKERWFFRGNYIQFNDIEKFYFPNVSLSHGLHQYIYRAKYTCTTLTSYNLKSI